MGPVFLSENSTKRDHPWARAVSVTHLAMHHKVGKMQAIISLYDGLNIYLQVACIHIMRML